LGYPVVIKPVVGSNVKGTYRVDSVAQFARTHARDGYADLATQRFPILVEGYVPMRGEYDCDGIVRQNTPIFTAVAHYFAPRLEVVAARRGGVIIDQTSDLAADIRHLNAEVTTALRLSDGITHLEVFDTVDGLVVGEVATRPAGGGITRTIHHAFGIDMWDEFIAVNLEESRPIVASSPSKIHARTHLPAYVEKSQIVAHPRVVEVSTPQENGSAHYHVHYAVDVQEEVETTYIELHSLAG
jgi:biotin carboxylase